MRITEIGSRRRCVAAPTAALMQSSGTWRSQKSRSGCETSSTDMAARVSPFTAVAGRATTRRRLRQWIVRALGSRSVFNALSQEKTGDFWVNGHMFGSQTCHTAEDVHHCDLLLVIGANPWIAHGFPNARDHLNQIRKDPARKLIVIDPRRTETAEMADLHLAVRPGADTFLLGALLATLVRSDRIDHAFIQEHTIGFGK
jgi:Anaerobic dehydrogenases, typically selenocysteine-containing